MGGEQANRLATSLVLPHEGTPPIAYLFSDWLCEALGTCFVCGWLLHVAKDFLLAGLLIGDRTAVKLRLLTKFVCKWGRGGEGVRLVASRFPGLFIPAPLHTYLAPPSSTLMASMLRAAHIFSLTRFQIGIFVSTLSWESSPIRSGGRRAVWPLRHHGPYLHISDSWLGSPTENGYFDVRALLNTGYIHLCRTTDFTLISALAQAIPAPFDIVNTH
ncbi:hypothetical protein PR048_005123 [Dryococelus australis]|uniref:Uncharacterized protein n=1 Tax=Dryococelus australis TaxID=614101 RepID=A0ABQ9I7B7_9NEOP|nr:hypothetical protein PR048_005123 [Dryococelus australis]